MNNDLNPLEAECVSAKQYHFHATIAEPLRATVSRILNEWNIPRDGGIVEISILPGGANNVNLVLDSGESKWALKVREANAALAGTSVEAAIDAQFIAAEAGVAPAIIASSRAEGHFLSSFVTGRTLRPNLIRELRLAPRMVDLLKRLHACKYDGRRYDIFDDIRVFMAGVKKFGGVYPAGYHALWDVAKGFETVLRHAQAPEAFGHNDLVPQNFIECADGLKLVDFDYAGQALVGVDLASLTSQAEMSDDETEALLKLYDPYLDDAQRARVRILRFVNALREVAWAAMAKPFMSHKTALLDNWSYDQHSEVNMTMAERMVRQTSPEMLSSKAVIVRPGALF